MTLATLLQKIQEQPAKDEDIWQTSFTILRHSLTIDMVVELIEYLPTLGKVKHVYGNSEVERCARSQYTGIKKWLTCFVNRQSTEQLQESPQYAIYEADAVVSIRRYQYINALFSRKKVNLSIFPNVEMAWLLSECAVFWKKVASQPRNTTTIHQSQKDDIDYLDIDFDDPSGLELFRPSTIEDFLDYADKYLEFLGKKCSESDATFKNLYFKPYLMARRHTSTIIKNKKQYNVRVNRGDGKNLNSL